jgi:indolepyruvate ferredoxin oxidoreductase
VNITYKILYNDAVAMTGGQPWAAARGPLGAADHEQPEGRGRAKLVIVTDEPQKYDGVALAPGVTVHHRDELDRIQRELRESRAAPA